MRITAIAILTLLLFAGCNDPAAMKKKMGMVEGTRFNPMGEFFPKDYFLINRNLPTLMMVVKKNQDNSELALTPEQKEQLEAHSDSMSKRGKPLAKKIKELEIELVNHVMDDGNTKEEVAPLLTQISDMRRQMTELQIDCINFHKKVLDDNQYQVLLKLASRKMM